MNSFNNVPWFGMHSISTRIIPGPYNLNIEMHECIKGMFYLKEVVAASVKTQIIHICVYVTLYVV